MPIVKTKANRIVLKNAESIIVAPYSYDSEEGYVFGNNMYDISAIVGDSIAIEQDDGAVDVKRNEFSTAPILQNTYDIRFKFAAQCLDLQQTVLRILFGTSDNNGVVFFNEEYPPQYALIRIRFKDSETPDVIMPFVQLDSRLFIQQLKTRAGQGNISGTAWSRDVVVVSVSDIGSVGEKNMLPITNPDGSASYVMHNPVAFVPRDYALMVSANLQSDKYVLWDYATGSKTNTYIDESTGHWGLSPF